MNGLCGAVSKETQNGWLAGLGALVVPRLDVEVAPEVAGVGCTLRWRACGLGVRGKAIALPLVNEMATQFGCIDIANRPGVGFNPCPQARCPCGSLM